MSEWKEYKLGEVAEVQTGPFGSQLHQSDYKAIGTPIITVEHLGDNRIIDSNLPLVGDEDKERLKKYTLKKGDVVFSRVGSVDRCAFVHEKQDGWMFSGRLLRVRAKENAVNSRFLSFYFCQESFKDTIRMIAVGATMPSINTEILSNVEILLPPLPEQRAIAGVLSSLDDKIDLLHRQNKTLEGMAEAIYRKIFVDGFQSEWSECLVFDLATHEKVGITPNREPLVIFDHYSIPAYDESCMPLRELGSTIQSNKYKVSANTILFSKLNPHKEKRIWLIPDTISEYSVCSTEFQVMKPIDFEYFYFLFGFISYPENYDEIAAGVGGTSGSHQRIDPEVIFKFKCFQPDSNTLQAYNEAITPIFKKMHQNRISIQTLRHQRDLLLPKLMSGEVRVEF